MDNKLLEDKKELIAALQSLLNKVNVVTAYWRHSDMVNVDDLDALCNRQIEVEAKLKEIESR